MVQEAGRCRRGRRAAGRARNRQGDDRGACARRRRAVGDRREGRRDRRGRRAARPDQGRRGRRAGRAGTGAPDKKQSTTAPIKAGADEIKPRAAGQAGEQHAKAIGDSQAAGMPAASSAEMPPSVRKLSAESGVDASTVAGLRQGRPRHQGRHDGRDRARRLARRRRCSRRPPPCRCARRRRPTTPRARSA